MRRMVASAAVVGLILGLAACGDGGAGRAAHPSATRPPSGRSHQETPPSIPAGALGEALRLAPKSVDQVRFVDQQRIFEQAGVGDTTAETANDSAKLATFRKATGRMPATSVLLDSAGTMRGWSWSGLDVAWEMQLDPHGTPVTIDRLRDGVDMSGVVASFENHGFTASRSGGVVRLDAPDDLVQRAPEAVLFSAGAMVIPARHLVISDAGSHPAYTVPRTADSFLARTTVHTVLPGVGRPAVLDVAVGERACADGSGHGASPGRLAKVTGWALSVPEAKHAQVVVAYDSAGAARADRAVRAKLMRSAYDVHTKKYANSFTGSVDADGPALRYDLTAQKAGVFPAMVRSFDTPWSFCGAT